MEIKVVCRDVDGTELAPPVKVCGNLKDAFSFKEYLDYDAEPLGFEVTVFIQTARRAIEVKKEHPNYRVRINVPFCYVGSYEYFDTFEDAMYRVQVAYDNGFMDVDLDVYKMCSNGVKRWEPSG